MFYVAPDPRGLAQTRPPGLGAGHGSQGFVLAIPNGFIHVGPHLCACSETYASPQIHKVASKRVGSSSTFCMHSLAQRVDYIVCAQAHRQPHALEEMLRFTRVTGQRPQVLPTCKVQVVISGRHRASRRSARESAAMRSPVLFAAAAYLAFPGFVKVDPHVISGGILVTSLHLVESSESNGHYGSYAWRCKNPTSPLKSWKTTDAKHNWHQPQLCLALQGFNGFIGFVKNQGRQA